jgi:hypothetical protein
MGNNNTTLLQLPAQSGKTRKATDLMNKWNEMFSALNQQSNVNIVFTSNNKLLTNQTAKRLQTDVKSCVDTEPQSNINNINYSPEPEITDDLSIDGDIPSGSKTIPWVSGRKSKHTPREMAMMLLLSEIDNVVCCTNKIRIEHVLALFDVLDNLRRHSNFQRNVNIWVDEADECIGFVKRYQSRFNQYSSLLYNVVLITATMRPVFKYVHKNGFDCKLRLYQNTHLPCYNKYSECTHIFNHTPVGMMPLQQIQCVLDDANLPATCRLFCPAGFKKSSHDDVVDLLLHRGFNVCILNGDRKQIVFSNRNVNPIDIYEDVSDETELSAIIRNYYYNYELYNAPFAVTGYLCIGRGITFASKLGDQEFMFTHGIIPDEGTAEDAYQLVARCLGNIKEYACFQKPVLYLNKHVHQKILQQEHIAVELARRYYTGVDEDTRVITKEELYQIQKEKPVLKPSTKPVKPYKRAPLCLPFTQHETHLWSKYQEYVATSKPNRIHGEIVLHELKGLLRRSENETHRCLLNMLETTPAEKLYTYATLPSSEGSYLRGVTNVADASVENRPYIVGIPVETIETKNVCAIFVDVKNCRLCICILCHDDTYPNVYSV